ncbi:MAG: protein-glutamate O-methyltransferase CheR [Silvibacterium sp.]|nr:protein-glutamate O-methyltransferase CheR [Silvibacterium sp.]
MPGSDADFAYLREVVLEESGNVLDSSRDYLFESRLQGLLHETGLKTIPRLVAALREQKQARLKRWLAEAMTVNETSFFRDAAAFELLEKELLPRLIWARESVCRLRLWSAACASGQETYSLAMLVREHFPRLNSWEVEILGTDISRDMIRRARAGRYQRSEVNRGLPALYREKYLRRSEDEWEVVPEIRNMCRFHERNLCEGLLPLEKYDGILLRNVMLYFPAQIRTRLLLDLYRVLPADGFLLLGASEQPGLPEHFQAELAENACYYRPLQAA